MSLATLMKAYIISLFISVSLLYGLWKTIILLASDIPPLQKFGITITISAVVALVATVKTHSHRLEESKT